VGSGKPPGEKFLIKTFSVPPELWGEFVSLVPHKERSHTLCQYIQREVKRRRAS
jgi:hypothetical protein